MANRIEIDLSVEDKKGTIKKRTQDTKELNVELDKSQKLATGTQTGARAAAQARPMAQQMVEYGAARGVTGATGAASRDFAKQAEGLGGLVRLYATWAANIFAVTAAFNALKTAADTTNMVQGMNQLGVASGQALGSLAKQFVDVTGGAISLREAMGSTTKALSAGLGQKQFLQLGEVATKASKALGIDLNDAVNRLTRGIVKLEPELLDELGIYTKIGPATEEYARKVGKTASSLTDFERRQAFANAVLAEGTEKFSAIKIDANPYDKLSASLKNLEQTALELVNKVLGPLVNFLSQSPTALVAIVSSLGLTLLKQVIPAVSQYRKEQDEALSRSAAVAKQKAAEVVRIEEAKFAYIKSLAEKEADDEIKSYEDKEKKFLAIRGKKGVSAEIKGIITKTDPFVQEDIKKLDALEETLRGNRSKRAQRDLQDIKQFRDGIQAIIEKELVLAQIQEQARRQAREDPLVKQAVKESKALDAATLRRSIISTSTGNIENYGPIAGTAKAFNDLFTQVKTANLTPIQKGLTVINGIASILTSTLTGLVGKLASLFNWIGLAITVFSTLYSFISKNREESTKLSNAVDQSNNSFKIANETLNKFNATLTLDSVQAKANAMAGLSEAVQNVVEAFAKFEEKSNSVDRIWERIKGVFNLSELDTVAQSVSKNIELIFNNIATPQLKENFRAQLGAVLNVKDLDISQLEDIFKKATPAQRKALASLVDGVKTQNQAISSSISSLKDAFKAVDTAYQGLNNSLLQTDPVSNYAKELANLAKVSKDAFKDPQTAAATLADIIKDPEAALKRFGSEGLAAIEPIKQEFIETTKQIEAQKAQLEDLQATLKRTQQIKLGDRSSQDWQRLRLLPKTISNLEIKIQAEEASLGKFQTQLQEVAQQGLNRAFAIALGKVGTAEQLGQIEVQKTLANYLPKSIETIKLQADLERRSIDVRIGEIKAIYALTKQVELDRVQREIDNLEQKKSKASIQDQIEKFDPEITAKEQLKKRIEAGTVTAAIRSGELERTPETFAALQREQGFAQQLATLVSQKDQSKIKERIDTYLQVFDQTNKVLEDELEIRTKKLQADKEQTTSVLEQVRLDQEYLKETKSTRELIATKEARRAQLIGIVAETAPQATPQIRGAAQAATQEALKQLNIKQANFETDEKTKNNANARKKLEEEINFETQRGNLLLDNSIKLAELNSQSKLQGLESERALLEQNIQQTGFITQAEADRLREIDLQVISQQKQQALDLETLKLQKELFNIEQKRARLKDDPQGLQALELERALIIDVSERTVEGINQQFNARSKLRELQEDEGTRIKAYTDLFRASFDKMGDAIAEFAKTGKLDFKGLVNSILEDILRLELKMQAMEFYKAIRGEIPGFLKLAGNVLSGFFGGGTQAPAPVENRTLSLIGDFFTSSTAMAAKGGVFPTLEKFAMGGVFSNKIVNQPTLFKFARGTGLMGEAGPEAIMPLKRDGQGNLGVRSTQSNTEVVINNYTGERAETRETTDSRGNRRIEVIIGDMTAGELNRSGSSAQRSLKNTFGIQPQLIRR